MADPRRRQSAVLPTTTVTAKDALNPSPGVLAAAIGAIAPVAASVRITAPPAFRAGELRVASLTAASATLVGPVRGAPAA